MRPRRQCAGSPTRSGDEESGLFLGNQYVGFQFPWCRIVAHWPEGLASPSRGGLLAYGRLPEAVL
jgi:hypothetical protein